MSKYIQVNGLANIVMRIKLNEGQYIFSVYYIWAAQFHIFLIEFYIKIKKKKKKPCSKMICFYERE